MIEGCDCFACALWHRMAGAAERRQAGRSLLALLAAIVAGSLFVGGLLSLAAVLLF